jgi:hypothetical protein
MGHDIVQSSRDNLLPAFHLGSNICLFLYVEEMYLEVP